MITRTTSRWTYQPNGVTTSFAFDNLVLNAADLVVSWLDQNGNALALPGYTITGVGNPLGGTVAFNSAPATTAGSLLIIERQTSRVTAGGDPQDYIQDPASTRQYNRDQSIGLGAEAFNKLKRVLQLSPLDADGPFVFPPAALRANKALLFDQYGNPVVGSPLAQGVLVVSAFIQTLLSAADAPTTLSGLGFSAFMKGLVNTVDAPTFRSSIGAIDATTTRLVPQGRLSLVTGTPVMSGSQTACTLVYYTPYLGQLIPLWNGAAFVNTVFAELTNDTTQGVAGKAGPAAVGVNLNYDLFVWNDGGTIRLTRGPAWTSNTSRGAGAGTTELNFVQGYYVNKWAITNGPGAGYGTYVGSIRSDDFSQVDFDLGGSSGGGARGLIGIWNRFNRVDIGNHIYDTTANWTYAANAYRAANNSNGVRLNALAGLAEDVMDIRYRSLRATVAGGFMANGIGFNTTTGSQAMDATIASPAGNLFVGDALLNWATPFGMNYWQATELGDGGAGATWYGGASTGLVYKWRY